MFLKFVKKSWCTLNCNISTLCVQWILNVFKYEYNKSENTNLCNEISMSV